MTMFDVVAVGRDDDGVGVLDAGVAQQLQVDPLADEEAAGPVVAEPSERVLALVDTETSQPTFRSSSATAAPTRPQPTIITFTRPE